MDHVCIHLSLFIVGKDGCELFNGTSGVFSSIGYPSFYPIMEMCVAQIDISNSAGADKVLFLSLHTKPLVIACAYTAPNISRHSWMEDFCGMFLH